MCERKNMPLALLNNRIVVNSDKLYINIAHLHFYCIFPNQSIQ